MIERLSRWGARVWARARNAGVMRIVIVAPVVYAIATNDWSTVIVYAVMLGALGVAMVYWRATPKGV